jgi:hypothetical protein
VWTAQQEGQYPTLFDQVQNVAAMAVESHLEKLRDQMLGPGSLEEIRLMYEMTLAG